MPSLPEYGAMDIYLDANATTPVLDQARAAALAAMADEFGNPSSTHSTGLRARALVESTRALARQVLDAPTGQLLFLSGATEGIQTAVLSALAHWRSRRDAGAPTPTLLLHGATEHKAVSQALAHWNSLLGLGLQVQAIPVGPDGRHDLDWLRTHAPDAALVCTMAANNETGVISDLDGIATALAGSPALWLVDGVQALGKLPLDLARRGIDYAPFSGHKLYAPKGIGLLYVREGAPFTPLLAGGGQEGGQRSGTENMAGIAALGAVLAALGDGRTFRDSATLQAYRERLSEALRDAFPGATFNAPPALCLPTTLNFSVPGVSAKTLIDLFDAAQVRVSGGSACGAAKALPSDVLEAMGLPAWRTASAVRLSFGPAADEAFIDEACRRIRACGASLRLGGPEPAPAARADDGEAMLPTTLAPAALLALCRSRPGVTWVDVREACETRMGGSADLPRGLRYQAVPLSALPAALPAWLAAPDTPLVFVCRSGSRAAQAAHTLRRLGHAQAWSLAGGLALWPRTLVSADTAIDKVPS